MLRGFVRESVYGCVDENVTMGLLIRMCSRI